MSRRGPSAEQIISAFRQVERGQKVGEVCRGIGVSRQTYYYWKRKYGGLASNELRELRELDELWQLREENQKLKTLVVDLTFDNRRLQELLAKKI